jgi:hypothetical protein
MSFWTEWLKEGDLAGATWSGETWHFYLYGSPPQMIPGERVYIVAHGKLRGYAPLVRIERYNGQEYALVRHGGAVACTINEVIRGFRGWRYRAWPYEDERPFPQWQQP